MRARGAVATCVALARQVELFQKTTESVVVAANAVPFSKFGGRFLVRGGAREVVEGKVRARTVVLEFPSHEAALACYRSSDYQTAAALRKGKAELDLFIIEGHDGA